MVEWEMAEMRHMPLMDITKWNLNGTEWIKKRVNGKKGKERRRIKKLFIVYCFLLLFSFVLVPKDEGNEHHLKWV